METEEGFKRISVQELRTWMIEAKNFILVHTLPRDHFDKIHLPNAKHACVYEVTFPDRIKALAENVNQRIVLYGSSSESLDAVTAAKKLVRLGYKEIFTLEGGLSEWRRNGFPLEGDEPDQAEEHKPGLNLEEREYHVDVKQSVIEWTGRNPNVKHYGTIKLSKGEMKIQDGSFSGMFEVDMNSVENINLKDDELQPVLIAHLKSDDFFFVERFPKALFTIRTIELINSQSLSSPNIEVRGNLKLCGVQKEITFSATMSNLSEGGITVEAHFDLDRTKWKILYGSSRFFEHLGMHLVFDHISFELRIVFV